ncbi:hypothetical protein RhiXN_07106 [Rhizoctonia solani]|uniref:Uncharacterized protein n=1 Tax=Rhizoctonia solani TaxID=456999 RepID=A0A8H8P7W0_9AGAM|nr:uncharacterized protein RhiXN_07106 [Rhizoctonia solani]QRW25157.1 hypothetical protein RhiXN_07106 [Rhizoctonia solani]
MPATLPAEKAAQIKNLHEQQATLKRMIISIGGGPKAAASLSDPLAHTVPILGFQNFPNPYKLCGFNLQMLCGLNNNSWDIYQDKLNAIATKQGVDLQFSITKQPILQCVTNTVNKMVKLRPKIQQKISDPDWLIRQMLQGMLKASREKHNNWVTGKRCTQKPKTTKDNKHKGQVKGKNKHESKAKGEEKDEDKNKDKGKRDKKADKGKGKEVQEPDDESKDVEMTNVGDILAPDMPQASTGGSFSKDTDSDQHKGQPLFSNTNTLDCTPVPPICPHP